MPDTLLKLENLDAFYGDFQALYGVDLDVAQGEVLAIIGANGAGKTTLMRSISGLTQNAAQMVRYRGDAIGALRADEVAAKGIALVPEGRQLFPSLSVSQRFYCLQEGRVSLEGASATVAREDISRAYFGVE